MEIFKIITLSLSALLLFFVGTMRLSKPIKTYLKNLGIKLEKEVKLLNEMRGVNAVMMFSGVIILLGTIIPQFTFTSFVIATLILLGFAIGRIVSIRLDVKPNKLIVQGLISDLILGASSIFCLVNVTGFEI